MKLVTHEQYIASVKITHRDFYDYSKTQYTQTNKKILIICKLHGEFWQRADHHKRGSKCPKCAAKQIAEKNTKDLNEFVNQCASIYGDFYNYEKVVYKNCRTRINIHCPIHGEFVQTPTDHISGCGCPKCGVERIKDIKRKPLSDVISMANIKHKNYYDYSLVKYINNSGKVEIICPKHGIFLQNMANHIHGGRGCQKCSPVSKAEAEISKILISNHISFTYQKTFDDLRDKKSNRLYRFDFYVDKINTVIEFDGQQHFFPVKYWGGEEQLLKIQNSDEQKNEYCARNGIKLVRIKYDENIKQRLMEEKII